MIEKLTPVAIRDILDMLRDWRAGRLRPGGPSRRRTGAAPVGRYSPLHQITAVDAGAGTCTVQRVDEAGNAVAGTDLPGLLYHELPAVGDKVQLCRRSDGSLSVFRGGRGVQVSSDDTTAGYLYQNQALGKLLPGTHIAFAVSDPAGDERLTIRETGTRADASEALRVEVRTSDPDSPQLGRIWLRSDLS